MVRLFEQACSSIVIISSGFFRRRLSIGPRGLLSLAAVGASLFAAFLFFLLHEPESRAVYIPAPLPDTMERAAPEATSFNEFGQLSGYPGKVMASRPVITDKTIVAFTLGQSNAANHTSQRYASIDRRVLNFFDGKFYEAADPLLGAGGFHGSVWTNLANRLVEAGIVDQVILISTAVGGTSVKAWQDGGRLNAMFRQRLQQARDSGLVVTHFLWHQGESDHSMPPAEYSQGLIQVIRLAQRYFPAARFFVAQVSRCVGAPSPGIVEVQRNVTRRPGVYLGPDSDLIDNADRYDGCHFSGRAVERHADDWVKAIRTPRKEGDAS